jgi:hypothetical protein
MPGITPQWSAQSKTIEKFNRKIGSNDHPKADSKLYELVVLTRVSMTTSYAW